MTDFSLSPDRDVRSHHINIAAFVFSVAALMSPIAAYLAYHRYSFLAPESLLLMAPTLMIGVVVAWLMRSAGAKLQSAMIAAILVLSIDLQVNLGAHIAQWAGTSGLRVHPAILGVAGVAALWLIAWTIVNRLGERIAAVLAAGFGVMLLTTALGLGDQIMADDITFSAPGDSKSVAVDGPPVIVHLILDEHMGLEGIPTEIPGGMEAVDDLRRLYIGNAFRLFGRTYSRFPDTEYSVANMANYQSAPSAAELASPNPMKTIVEPGNRFAFSLTRNAYFEDMARRGYRVRAFQTPHLDYCRPLPAGIADCRTFPATSVAYLQRIDIPVLQKFGILYGVFANQSFLLNSAARAVTKSFALFGYPGTAFGPASVGPLPSFYMIDQLADQAAAAPPGTFIFAHLLAPHSPYAYGADCRLRPLGQPWLFITDASLTEPVANTADGREARYRQAFQQMLCLNQYLDRFFQRIRAAGRWDDTAIILHGDHGSRISRHSLGAQAGDLISDRDLIDGLNSHLAIKFPGVEPGYDRRRRAYQDIIAQAVAARPLPEEDERVYMHDKITSRFITKKMPEFSAVNP